MLRLIFCTLAFITTPFALTSAATSNEPWKEIDTDLGESKWDGEDEAAQQMIGVISDFINRRYKEGRRPAMRDAHAKAHGCVRAEFSVIENIPEKARVGVFATPGKMYPAWIRLSNGASEINPDGMADGRGMAIKLMNVPGEKILPEERFEKTQDFIMINHPKFFINEPKKYVKLLTAFHKKIIFSKTNFFNELAAFLELNEEEQKIAVEVIRKPPVGNMLETQFWSMVPYRLGVGEKRTAVKYTAKPCQQGPLSTVPFFGPDNFLRKRLAETLAKSEVCYNFYMQFRVDHVKTPIELSTVEWKEDVAPPVHVAQIKIPKQIFATDEQMDFCEHTSFSPWHALPEHKPLGATNRARAVVYTAISKLRHGLNNAKRQEPSENHP